MSQPSNPLSFLRQTGPIHPQLVVSTCLICGLVVGASPDRRNLAMAENLHSCKPGASAPAGSTPTE